MTDDTTGKRIRTENLAGQATTTAWDYDDEDRLVASSGLIPLNLTNVTWVATCYAYDDVGELVAVTNALGHATVYEYDLRGQKAYEGGATYPVRYAYDVFGNKIAMTTYRDEGGTRSVASVGDTTRWLRDEATGAVTNKVYADGSRVAYAYTDDGKLAERVWARGVKTW